MNLVSWGKRCRWSLSYIIRYTFREGRWCYCLLGFCCSKHTIERLESAVSQTQFASVCVGVCAWLFCKLRSHPFASRIPRSIESFKCFNFVFQSKVNDNHNNSNFGSRILLQRLYLIMQLQSSPVQLVHLSHGLDLCLTTDDWRWLMMWCTTMYIALHINLLNPLIECRGVGGQRSRLRSTCATSPATTIRN